MVVQKPRIPALDTTKVYHVGKRTHSRVTYNTNDQREKGILQERQTC